MRTKRSSFLSLVAIRFREGFGPRTVLPGDSITVLAGGTATTVGCALVIVLGWIAIFGARNR
jgi:hypothetical protein